MKEYFIKKLDLKIIPNTITIVIGNSYTFIQTLKRELIDSQAFIIYKNKLKAGTIKELLIHNKVDLDSEKYLNLITELKLKKFVNSKKTNLSNEDKILLSFIILLYHAKNRILIEEDINYLNNNLKEKILKYIHDKSLSLIMITNNMELSLFADNIVLINDEKVIINDKKEEVLERISELKALGCDVPFVVDLSMQLKYYDAVNRLYFDNKELVGELWK